jgi:ribosome-associated toxin RatA of RatAB toxin-antitoxin module
MSVAKASIEINAPLKSVYEVICDFEAYPEFLTETKDVVVEKASDKSALVVFTVSIIKKITYTLDIKMTPLKSVSWKLVNGDMMKKNTGHWKLSEKGGVTHAEYEIDMDFGGMVPKAISSKLIGSNLPAMMRAFRDRVEDLAS